MTYLLIHQDVATDAWSIVLVDEEYLGYARGMKIVGRNIGGLITYNIFIELNSAKFCNKYIFSTARKTGLISNQNIVFF